MKNIGDILKKWLAPDEVKLGTRAQRRHPYQPPADPTRIPKGGSRRRRWLESRARSRRRERRRLTQAALNRV